MRYLGQWRSLSVPIDVGTARPSPTRVARFHDEHEREFAYRRDGAPVEIYQLELQRGRRDAEARARPRTSAAALRAARAARACATCTSTRATPSTTPVYRRDDLPAGVALRRARS